uniref:Non-lysosomal glucosylceramidase isoform X2 n=1 Tax=Rhizophora mucronata TaxID=61149 RepID=A0A2P2KU69_RHIMU
MAIFVCKRSSALGPVHHHISSMPLEIEHGTWNAGHSSSSPMMRYRDQLLSLTLHVGLEPKLKHNIYSPHHEI